MTATFLPPAQTVRHREIERSQTLNRWWIQEKGTVEEIP